MISLLVSIFRVAAYYLFLSMCFSGIWFLNIRCWMYETLRIQTTQHQVRNWIFKLTRFYVLLMRKSGCLRLEIPSIPGNPSNNGCIWVANHPSLLDAPIFLSLSPRLICIYKSSLHSSLFKPRTARMAGYIANDGGISAVRKATQFLKAGYHILVFPEGTRTNGITLNPFNPGYALMAKRAEVAVQIFSIHCKAPLLGKNRHFLLPPELPANVRITILDTFHSSAYPTSHQLNNAVEQSLQTAIIRQCNAEQATAHE